MENCKHLIVGAGPAGLAAAQAIREVDKKAEITIVTREQTLPYSPAALPYVVSEELAAGDLFIKGRNVLQSLNVTLLLGKEVAEIAPQSKEVIYSDGGREFYHKLLIATGAHPTTLELENLGSDQVYTFRTVGDCERLCKALDQKQEIAIWGGGLVAVELAEKLCLAGHSVTIIVRSSLLRVYFSRKAVAKVEDAFRRHGVTVLTGDAEVAAKPVASRLELTLKAGEKITVDRFVMAVGVAANKIGGTWAGEGGLKVGMRMETDFPDIYAAGDAAAAPSFFDGHHGPCPILPEAVLQGRVAGTHMAGGCMDYKGWIQHNYLRCFEENLFSIGIIDQGSDPAYQTIEKEEPNGFLRLLLKDECLVGAEGLNVERVHPGVFLSLIRKRIPVSNHRHVLLSQPKKIAYWLMQQWCHRQAV